MQFEIFNITDSWAPTDIPTIRRKKDDFYEDRQALLPKQWEKPYLKSKTSKECADAT